MTALACGEGRGARVRTRGWDLVTEPRSRSREGRGLWQSPCPLISPLSHLLGLRAHGNLPISLCAGGRLSRKISTDRFFTGLLFGYISPFFLFSGVLLFLITPSCHFMNSASFSLWPFLNHASMNAL